MTATETTRPAIGSNSPAKAWLRALELTAPIAGNRARTFPVLIEELAGRFGDEPALLSDEACLSYRALDQRANQYARWALHHGLQKGDSVCLFMRNRPEYLAIWLGITRAGGVVALLNTNLTGTSLAHCANLIDPKHVIAGPEQAGALAAALPDLNADVPIWSDGSAHPRFHNLNSEINLHASNPLSDAERRPVTIDDRALCIYTSGTTGLPKAANVSHGRIMQWSHWFAGMLNVHREDRMYNCLPMYHSVGGVVATGAMLAGGGSVVLRDGFSAAGFWNDIVRWDCSLFQYIGELCRYLLHAPPCPNATQHRIRMSCGNGLRPDIWEEFQSRFRIPRILEFYASTESGVSLFNVEDEVGAIGRVPAYLAHRASPVLVRSDLESGSPFRDARGHCVRCGPNEAGEAISPLQQGASNLGNRFEGYTSAEASEQKILRDVFENGDAWVRTGDLMRKDERGFYYFVDRIGDTFRWKGENVSTSEVSSAICEFPGVKEATVYGVSIPGADGRAGMATLVTGNGLDLEALRVHLNRRLPAYARPLFLRIRKEIDITGTFKHEKSQLVREGFDPAATEDPLYFNHPQIRAFVQVDPQLYQIIQTGRIRL